MKPVVSRLLVFGLLYAGWMVYLGYLVLTRPVVPPGIPLVVSVPQVQTSTLDVIAELPSPPGRNEPLSGEGTEVTVQEVLYSKDDSVKVEQKLQVVGLDDSHPPARTSSPPPKDWSGPGSYLLPLRPLKTPTGKVIYEVAPIPPSPGYGGGPPRIYPATVEARAQYHKIAKPGE